MKLSPKWKESKALGISFFTVLSGATMKFSLASNANTLFALLLTLIYSSVAEDEYPIEIPSPYITPIEEGSTIPSVTFKTRTRIDADIENPFEWKDRTTEEYFKNKRCIVFGLPGAFTPTCTTSHLPGYEAAYDELKALGIDEVYCLSVNDAFVMRMWGLHLGLPEDKTPGSLGFENVKLIPDGNAQFTRGMGMSTLWSSERGFGERSWRYSAVVDDMKIEKLFIEGGTSTQNSEPDPLEVSDADTMLEYLKSVANEGEEENVRLRG